MPQAMTPPATRSTGRSLQQIEAAAAARIDQPPELTPEALEQVGVSTVRLWAWLVFSCVALLAWAAVFPLDVVSVAEGTVEPSSRLQKVQHLEGGIVKELLVREGELVEHNQLLVRLEPVQSGADVGEVVARQTALEADRMRLEAEAAGAALEIPPAFEQRHPELARRTQAFYQARRDTLRSSVETQERQIAEISARLANTRARYRLANEQVGIGRKLIAENLSNRYEQIEREKEANALKSRIEEDEAALGRAQAELASVRNRYDEEVGKELSDVRRQLAELESRGEKFRDQLQRTELRAPMAGVVKTLYVNNLGAVIPQGGTVLDLVPGDDRMIVEARLPPQDVGYVRKGQQAVVQLASADASRLGRIEGVVEHVSPDAVTAPGATGAEAAPYFVVRIVTERSYFGTEHDRYELTPGVAVTVGIVTGQRTVLGYLLYPISRTMPFALGER